MTETITAGDPGRDARKTRSVLAELTTLRTMSTPALKARWRELFAAEAPVFSRSYLESRLIYRIQELAFGGLNCETLDRLVSIGEQLDGGKSQVRRLRQDNRPIAGTQLTREYQGTEHRVTVLHDGYEWRGRPFRSLSAIARAITGTRWNGLVFFGLKNQRGRA